MMKTKVMTYALVGGLIGFFLGGPLQGAAVGILLYIAIQLDELVEVMKNRS